MTEEQHIIEPQIPPLPIAEPLAIKPLDLAALRAKAIQQLDAVLPAPTAKRTYSYAELHDTKDDVQKFLVPDLLPSEAVCVLIGEDGIGKTQLCTQLCACIGFGLSHFVGVELNVKHKAALIVASEDSRKKFIKAFVKQTHTMQPGHNPKDLNVDFMEASDFDDFAAMKDELETLLRTKFYDLVVLDALGDTFTLIDGDINSNSHARKLLSFFQHLCNTYGVTMVIIHHAAKSKMVMKRREGKMFVEKSDSQGAGAITQKPRTVIALTNDPGTIQDEGNRYVNYLHVVKANLMGKRFMQMAIKLQFTSVDLLHRQDGLVDIQMMQTEEIQKVENDQKSQLTGRKTDFNVRKPGPADIIPAMHHQKLVAVYGNNLTLSREVLVARMTNEYGVGTGKIEQKGGYLNYLTEQGFITKSEFGFSYKRPAGPQAGWTPVAAAGDDPDTETPF